MKAERRVSLCGTVEMDEMTEHKDQPSLTMYKKNFEEPFIEATKAYYTANGDILLRDATVFELVSYVSMDVNVNGV